MTDAAESGTGHLCPFCEEGQGVQVLSRRIVQVGGAGMTNEPSRARPSLVAVPHRPRMVCGQCGSEWVTLEQHELALKLVAQAVLSPQSNWQMCWDTTVAELAALQARFVEIHGLPKEQIAAAEPELKALRKQAIALGNERYALVSALRRLPPGLES